MHLPICVCDFFSLKFFNILFFFCLSVNSFVVKHRILLSIHQAFFRDAKMRLKTDFFSDLCVGMQRFHHRPTHSSVVCTHRTVMFIFLMLLNFSTQKSALTLAKQTSTSSSLAISFFSSGNNVAIKNGITTKINNEDNTRKGNSSLVDRFCYNAFKNLLSISLQVFTLFILL